MKNFFKVLHRSKKSKARLGEIIADHGVIKTPAFVPVATKGTIKSLLPNLLKEIGIQVAFVNTYHLVNHPGVEVIEKKGGIHHYSKLEIPLMSDSGGFQVFSLSKDKNKKKVDIRGEEKPLLLKISDDKVVFRSLFDGQLVEFTPEKSVEYQAKIGADINMAFDECIAYQSDYQYTKKATLRTHRWLERSIKEFNRQRSKRKARQFLYGIIQGGVFEDLRKQSAKFVVSQNTDGVAIGGVSVGETKKEMRDQVRWVSNYLPKDRPVHLLGVGQFDDILDLVSLGIDTFDCVEPTRLARMGRIYQAAYCGCEMRGGIILNSFQDLNGMPKQVRHDKEERMLKQVRHDQVEKILKKVQYEKGGRMLKQVRNDKVERMLRKARYDMKVIQHYSSKNWSIDINRLIYKNNLEPVDINCDCFVCKNFTKSYLHHLFKQRELLGYTLATYHNLYLIEEFFKRIREMIEINLI